jgi:hypothetical protein
MSSHIHIVNSVDVSSYTDVDQGSRDQLGRLIENYGLKGELERPEEPEPGEQVQNQ